MKTKQITDISLRTFENTTEADLWIDRYGDAAGANNEIVFNGLQYNNKEDGKRYEAAYTTEWDWNEIILDLGDIVIPESELGGANLFIVDSQGLSSALADPQYDQEILQIDSNATVVESITVDNREDTVDPNIQAKIETDSGKEYVTDYFILDATNEDSSTGGLPILGTVNKVDMVFVGNDVINDRRFRGDINFSSKPAGVEVTQVRVAGNGGQSVLIPINRANIVTAPTDVDNFQVETPASADHTHVRSTQTFTLDFHFDLTNTANQFDATFSTEIELSGASVDGTYTYTIPSGDRPTFPSGTTDFVVTVIGIPANTTLTTDTGDLSFVCRNAEKVSTDPATLSFYGSTWVLIDNTLPTISGGVVVYPNVPNSARYGALQQKAYRNLDISGSRSTSVDTTIQLGSIDFGSGGFYQIQPNTGFSSTTAGNVPITGSIDTDATFVIDGIPGSGAATITNAFTVFVMKSKINYSVTLDVEVRYQQADVALTDSGVREGRDSGFTRTYTYNQEVLAAVVEVSDDILVVPNGTLTTSTTTTQDLVVVIDQFTTLRQTYNYQLFSVGEAGEELLNSEIGPTDNNIDARGFTIIRIDYSKDSGNNATFVSPGTYNGITVPNNSYEIDLQSAATPGVAAGSVLTVIDDALLIATGATSGTLITYSLVGSQWVYIDNSVGTGYDIFNLEETVV